MYKIGVAVFIASSLIGCGSSKFFVEEGGIVKNEAAVMAALRHSMWIKCEAEWGKKCYIKSRPEWDAVIPEGYVHCKTVNRNIEGPTTYASSRWFLKGNRVTTDAAACGGSFADRYRSWVKVEWTTYMVPRGFEKDSSYGCTTAEKGHVGQEDLKCVWE